MRWTRITPFGDKRCATNKCLHSARWHMEAGDVGSDYCSICKDAIVDLELRQAAEVVASYDCSDCDQDFDEAVVRLRDALNN